MQLQSVKQCGKRILPLIREDGLIEENAFQHCLLAKVIPGLYAADSQLALAICNKEYYNLFCDGFF